MDFAICDSKRSWILSNTSAHSKTALQPSLFLSKIHGHHDASNIVSHDRAYPGVEKFMSFCDIFDLTNTANSKLASPKIIAPPLMSFLPIDGDLSRKRLFLKLA